MLKKIQHLTYHFHPVTNEPDTSIKFTRGSVIYALRKTKTSVTTRMRCQTLKMDASTSWL